MVILYAASWRPSYSRTKVPLLRTESVQSCAHAPEDSAPRIRRGPTCKSPQVKTRQRSTNRETSCATAQVWNGTEEYVQNTVGKD